MENHEDLAVAVNPPPVVALPIQAVRFIPPANGTAADDTGHGTMLAGIIGALRDNATGVAGEGRFINIARPDQRNMTILALKITDEVTPPSALAAATAIQYAIGMGARIINIAWHVLATSDLLRRAIETAAQAPQGCLVVIAAGNYGSDNTMIPTLPASWGVPDTIAVMASDRNDYKSWFSNYGGNVDLAAPGERVYTTGIYYVNPRYQEFNGTSAAVAHVSAAAALLLSIDDWTPAEIRVHLNESADRPPVLWGTCISNGRLNLRRAVCGPFQIVAPAGGQGLQGGQLFNVQWTLEYASTIVTHAEISFINDAAGNILGPPVVTAAANLGAQVMIPNAPGIQAFVRVRGVVSGVARNLYTDSHVFRII
jgi:subtilisin family serine protease